MSKIVSNDTLIDILECQTFALIEKIIIVNGKERNYETLELANKGEIFKVDKRYKIELDNLPTVNKEMSLLTFIYLISQ